MAYSRTTRKPDSPLQAEAQQALREALSAIRNHTVNAVAARSGVSADTLYAHLSEAPSRKYPLRVPPGRLRAVARAMESEIEALKAAVARLDSVAEQMEAEDAEVSAA